jgi:hypothetical protein
VTPTVTPSDAKKRHLSDDFADEDQPNKKAAKKAGGGKRPNTKAALSDPRQPSEPGAASGVPEAVSGRKTKDFSVQVSILRVSILEKNIRANFIKQSWGQHFRSTYVSDHYGQTYILGFNGN